MPRGGVSDASLVARVRRTIEERRLLTGGRAVLVAVSGGPDSMAMLDALARLAPELDMRLAVASADHGLRPEARDEVAFVRAAALERDLPFRGVELHLASGSSHATARLARYDALRSVARDLACDSIAVGHTVDDQAETVVARLLRGSGLRGLRGILDRREDGVIRPLLDSTRADVRRHLAHFELRSVEDPSNRDRQYLRVRVRHELLPELAKESPEIVRHLAAIADESAEFADFVDELAVRFREESGRTIARDLLERLPRPARAAAIAEFIRFHAGKSPSRRVVEAVSIALRSGGSVWIGGGLALEGDSEKLELHPIAQSSQRSVTARRPKE